MATNFMNFTKHTVAGSSKLAATNGGAHIYNVKATADIDNGCIVGRGAYQSGEYYAEAAASSTFAAKIIDTAANGNYYVEVTATAGDLLVLTTPLVYEEYTTRTRQESNFYNAKGDIMRCYELVVGDIFEVSAEGISGTIAKGAGLNVVSKKLTVVAED